MSISTLKVSELKDLLKEHNCTVPSGANKQKLIELAEEVMSDQVLETQLEFGENTLRWTITNSCSNSFAEVTILNTGQCEDEDSLNNELIFYVPNSFTPNIIDDLNSVFQPVFTSGYDPLKFSLLIFDRWGELVFESYNADIGWTGTYGTKGRLAQDGVYVWKIGYTDLLTQEEHQVIGHVVLLR